MTWEKLNLEIELLNLEETSSMLPLVIGTNSLLCPEDLSETVSRKLSFMGYELTASCESKAEDERLAELNRYFFEKQQFQVSHFDLNSRSESDLLIKDVMLNKRGSALPISLLYLHLANHLDLPVYLINLKNSCILKWVRGGKSEFIDLCQGGKVLDEENMVRMLNQSLSRVKDLSSPCLDILPCKQILQKYMRGLKQYYKSVEDKQKLLIVLNIMIKLDPSQLKPLSERALLQKELGLTREALADIKRYFAFVDKEQAPAELRMVYYELMATKNLVAIPPEILH